MAAKLVRRTLVLAKLESTYGVDSIPTAALDAILVSAPDVSVDGQKLERDFVRATISPLAHRIGRKVVKVSFTTELKSNGSTMNGDTNFALEIDPLFQACGFMPTYTAETTPGEQQDVTFTPTNVEVGDSFTATINAQDFTYVATAATVANVCAGLTALINAGQDAVTAVNNTTEVEVTADVHGVAFTYSSSTIDGGGTSSDDQTLDIVVLQANVVGSNDGNVVYQPVSTDFESATVYINYDGLLHKITGCVGTFSLKAEAGQYGSIAWELSGLYTDVEDEAITDGTYDITQPPIVESLGFTIGDFTDNCVQAFEYMSANEIAEQQCVNAISGLKALRITRRGSTGSINPEATSVADEDFWADWKNSTPKELSCTIGSVVGNIIEILIPKAVYDSIAYGDREGIRTFEIPFVATTTTGDDEITLTFR